MYLVMWTHVRDYDDWKAAFDGAEPLRREFHCAGLEIYRDVDDQNMLTVFLEFPSRERAEAFLADPRLEEKMQESGADSEMRTMFVSQTKRPGRRGDRAA